jgi:hypothetical protein
VTGGNLAEQGGSTLSESLPAPGMAAAPKTPLFRDFLEIWYAEKQVERRRSHSSASLIAQDAQGIRGQ